MAEALVPEEMVKATLRALRPHLDVATPGKWETLQTASAEAEFVRALN